MTRWDHAVTVFTDLWLVATGITLLWVAFKLAGVCR